MKIIISLFCIGLLFFSLITPSLIFNDNIKNSFTNNNDLIQNKLSDIQSDTVGIKENVKIIKFDSENNSQEIFDNDDLFHDSVSINDSVGLVIYHNVIKPITHNIITTFDRIFEKQRLTIKNIVLTIFEKNIDYQISNPLNNKIIFMLPDLNILNSNFVIDSFDNNSFDILIFDENLIFLIMLAPLFITILFNL